MHRGGEVFWEGDRSRRHQRRRRGGKRRRPQLAYKKDVSIGAFTPLTFPGQFPSLYDSQSCLVFQWLHLHLSYTYPLRQPFQRPESNPFVLPLLISFLRFLRTSLFLSAFLLACLADEAVSPPDRILLETMTVWKLWIS